MNTGHTEKRTWTSIDGRRSDEIDVFVPAPIAEQVVVGSDPAIEAETERALLSLRGAHRLEPVGANLLRSEGIASSMIEGEVASTRRVYEAEYAPDDVSDPVARRVANSIRVMADVIEHAGEGVNSASFSHWHEVLFAGTHVRFAPGRVRSTQNWIGTRTDTPVGAVFVPPSPDLVAAAMTDLAAFVNRTDCAPLAQSAIAHAHFETIHPYPDGNGRIGRALVYRCWAYRGVTGSVVPPISRILVENREAYVDGLTAYRRGDVDAWLGFFFDTVVSAVSYTRSLAEHLRVLENVWSNRLSGARSNSLARRIVGDLVAHPILSASDVAGRYGVTDRGAGIALDGLVERGILTHRPLRRARRGRPLKVFEATELFDLLDLSPRELA
jgi:Fic family protein